jgi:hypothetical protein
LITIDGAGLSRAVVEHLTKTWPWAQEFADAVNCVRAIP